MCKEMSGHSFLKLLTNRVGSIVETSIKAGIWTKSESE